MEITRTCGKRNNKEEVKDMYTNDFVTPFFSSTTVSLNDEANLAMDLTQIIVKLFFEAGKKIEKKYGNLENIACGYWPFYMVPINANNAYILEAHALYSEKIKTKVITTKLPTIGQDLDEGSIDKFIRSMDKYVTRIEAYPSFEREEKKIDGLIPSAAFGSYFVHLFKASRKPYLDVSFCVEPTMSETAVNYMHEEIIKIFDDEPVNWMHNMQAEYEKLCNKWIAKVEELLNKQEQNPVKSLKNKSQWNYPSLSDPLESMIDNLKKQVIELRNQGKNELVKESITQSDVAIATSYDVSKNLEDYKRGLKNTEERIQQEAVSIGNERKYWQDSIDALRKLMERMRQAVKGFEDQEKILRSKFLEEKTIAFKTGKVVRCGVPVFLLNFTKKGKLELEVMPPMILEEVSTFHKNPFKKPKGYDEYLKWTSDHFLKPQNDFEIQKSIKEQDLLSLPNLKIDVSNGIDRLLDLGYLDKKKHGEIRDEELHDLFSKGT